MKRKEVRENTFHFPVVLFTCVRVWESMCACHIWQDIGVSVLVQENGQCQVSSLMPFHRIFGDGVSLNLMLRDSVSEFQGWSWLSIPHAGITGAYASFVGGKRWIWTQVLKPFVNWVISSAQDFPFLPEVLQNYCSSPAPFPLPLSPS